MAIISPSCIYNVKPVQLDFIIRNHDYCSLFGDLIFWGPLVSAQSAEKKQSILQTLPPPEPTPFKRMIPGGLPPSGRPITLTFTLSLCECGYFIYGLSHPYTKNWVCFSIYLRFYWGQGEYLQGLRRSEGFAV